MPGKTKSTIMIDSDLWKRLRVVAILNEFEISELVEEALREKLARMRHQPEQDPAYKDVQNVRYKPKGLNQKIEAISTLDKGLERPQQQNQEEGVNPPDNLEDNRLFEIDEELAALRKHVDRYWNNGKINLYVSGLKFPKNKEEIIQFAIKKKDNVEPVTEVLSRIPDRTYKDEKDLMHTFAKEYHELFDKILHSSTERLKQLKPSLSSSSGRLRRWQIQPYLDKKSSKMGSMEISIK